MKKIQIIFVGLVIFISCSANSFAGTAKYTYDDLNRLIHVERDNGILIDYSYDAAGNRTSRIIYKDSDGDGLSDQLENETCTDPNDDDTDGDGLFDDEEDINLNGRLDAGETDPCDPDTDGDGLKDGDEVNRYGTAPTLMDSDGDGMPDGFEITYFGKITRNGSGDYDGDGLTDLKEYQNMTNPKDTDSDDDGLTDGVEVNTYKTSPILKDTDNDGMPDAWEVQYGLNPLVNDGSVDTDEDGYTNLRECHLKTNPADPNSYPAIKSMPWLQFLLE
jgi:YD repeat-containing protein